MDFIDPNHAELYEIESLPTRTKESQMTEYISNGNELVEVEVPATVEIIDLVGEEFEFDGEN